MLVSAYTERVVANNTVVSLPTGLPALFFVQHKNHMTSTIVSTINVGKIIINPGSSFSSYAPT